MLAGIGAGGQLAVDGGAGQQGGIGGHHLHRLLYLADSAHHLAHLVLRFRLEFELEVARGHLLRGIDHLIDRPGDAAGDEESQQNSQGEGSQGQGHDDVGGLGR